MSEDPLDALRQAWQHSTPPPLHPEPEDALTRASVAWCRQSWQQLQPPVVRVPVGLRRRPRRARLLRPIAAAAAVLVGALAWYVSVPGGGLPPASSVASAPPAEAPSPSLAEGAADPPPLQTDRVELRRGPVRLILMFPEQLPEGP